jgi:maltooligosyltrehalose trehalohydrolase
MHIGTFTPEGTFEAVIPHLQRLKDLGITTLELMPVGAFPGTRNWGYDGVQPYAPHVAYGGVDGLKTLVNAAHQTGLAVMLDVVYNHLGPEGNYLWDYAPYFTDRYTTPWGEAVNLDGAHSDPVRRYIIENALYWLHHYHIDGLRLDATHALYDTSAHHLLDELTAACHDYAAAHSRRVHLIAENDRSDRRLLLPPQVNGTNLDGVWLDDLHHALHVHLTDETKGYYEDYGDFALLGKILDEGFAYSGQYSLHRERTHGSYSGDIPADHFVTCIQNHDQVGNRMLGERLNQLTDFNGLKVSAGLLLTAPYVPLLFMGQEYADPAPFLYFVSHTDDHLIEAVREGRAAEFADFEWSDDPPDPFAQSTFERSQLNHSLREAGKHQVLYEFYRALLHLRHESAVLRNPRRDDTQVQCDAATQTILLDRRAGADRLLIALNLHLQDEQTLHLPDTDITDTGYQKMFDSNAAQWQPDSASSATTAPDSIDADSDTAITLPAKSFVIYRA